MSNQAYITGDLQIRSLTGALTATSGVVSSLPLGTANGIATLGTDGKVPSSQLPTMGSSYKGTWDASTNTPYIHDGTGTAGDYYLVSVGGTQNLGSGSQTFLAGNTVIYSGTIWQKAGGGSGTVTSVGFTAPAAFTVTGSPITSSGTIALTGAGTGSQYIKGDGTLATFPSIPTVSGTTNYISKFTGSSTLGNSLIFDNGVSVGIGTITPNASFLVDINGLSRVTGNLNVSAGSIGSALNVYGVANYYGAVFLGSYVTGQSNGITVQAGTNSSDTSLLVTNYAGTSSFLVVKGNGNTGIGTTSPGDLLQIGSSTTRGTMSIFGTSSGRPVLQFNNNAASGGNAWNLYAGLTAAGSFDIYDNNALTTRFSITNNGSVLIGSTTDNGQGTLQNVGSAFLGGLQVGALTFSASTTATTSKVFYYFNGSSSATLTLPSTSGISSYFVVKNGGSFSSTLTISRSGSDTIIPVYSTTPQTTIVLSLGSQAVFISNGAGNWVQISS